MYKLLRLATVCGLAMLMASPALAEGWWIFNGDDWRWTDSDAEPVNALSAFYGTGTEDNFSETVTNPFGADGSGDKVIGFTYARRFAWFADQLSFEGELMYARHFDRETYHEVGAAVYARWHKFPWNRHVVTSFAVGMGPSYTTIYPELEKQSDPNDRSKLLNQFNLEVTLAMPSRPRTSLIGRLQHRSGVFGFYDNVTDASNFLSLGLRHEF